LEEPLTPRTDNFNILVHWKAATRYPILASIARDIYTITISIVASESVFSTGGRFISLLRNRLHPKTLEALLCGRDWLLTTIKSSSKGTFLIFCYTFRIYSEISLCLNVMIFDNLITLTYLLCCRWGHCLLLWYFWWRLWRIWWL